MFFKTYFMYSNINTTDTSSNCETVIANRSNCKQRFRSLLRPNLQGSKAKYL